MNDIIAKLQDMINEDIYCIFDNGDEYLSEEGEKKINSL